MFIQRLLIFLLIGSTAQAFSLDKLFSGNAPFPDRRKVNEARPHANTPRKCSAYSLRQFIKNSNFRRVQDFFLQCDPETPGQSKIEIGLQVALDRAAFEKRHRYQTLDFTISTGEKVRGVLALKDTSSSLPLVIIRSGIYGKADFSFTNSLTLLSYFEYSPFHVLLIENSSNEDFIRRNGTLRVGGLSGGMQILDVTKQIKNSQYRSKFSEFHLVGFSLGAHDSLYANVFSNKDSGINFRSVTALCPAMDLEPSIRNVFDNELLGSTNSRYLKNVIRRQWERTPALRAILSLPSAEDFDRTTVRDLWVDAASAQLFISGETLPYPISTKVQNTQEFLKLSTFARFSNHIKTPTYIIQAQDDSVTPYQVNLRKYQLTLTAHPNSNVNTLVLEHGEHCAYGHVYGIDRITSLLNGIVMKHSSLKNDDVVMDARQLFANNQWPRDGSLVADYKAVDLKLRGHNLIAEVEFSFFDSSKISTRSPRGPITCNRFQYWEAPKDCLKKIKIDVPAQYLGMRDRPGSQEANASITRFNVTGAILDGNRKEVLGSSNRPAFIQVPEKLLKQGYY